VFFIATDVDGVALGYGHKDQRFLRTISVTQAARYILDDQFPPGTMQPKVEAAMQFVSNHGKRAVITSLDNIIAAVEGRAGTEFTRE
jgi:carbamate kinase